MLRRARVWARRIRKQDMWWDGAASKTHQIGGRVYQQAYDNNWVSYKHDARKKGVHGYQFRSPAEWFAELYAAFYSGKMKTSHPMYAEFEALGEADDLSPTV